MSDSLLLIFMGMLLMANKGHGQSSKPAVFILTDINLVGGDPDDQQSLVHLLWYSNELDIVGIVPDRWNGKGIEACEMVLKAYQEDFENHDWSNQGFARPQEIRDRIARNEETAINMLINAADQREDPLYVLVWGNMETLRKALFQNPGLASQIRVLSIGTGLKYGPKDEVAGTECDVPNWNGRGRLEIYQDPRFHKMWWLENNWTYNGMFMGSGPTQMFEQLGHFGAMGQHIHDVTSNHAWARYFRVGDTPSVLYLLDPTHDVDNPEESSWAGKFKKPFPQTRPNYFTDDNGEVAWNYEDPCLTWSNLLKMYAHNKNTLYAERPQMYQSLLERLTILYGTE